MLNSRIISIQDYMNNELKSLNTNVNNKLDNIVTTIIEKSPTSSTFKTPDSEEFMSAFNNDIKNNMNDSINELKGYIKNVIDTKINEKFDNASNNNNNNNNALNANLINELMARINNDNDNRIREMEERFNKKLEALANSRSRSNTEEQNAQTKSMLEDMGKSIKELKTTMNAKNNDIERLTEITQQINKNASNSNESKEDENLKYMEFTKSLEEDLKQQLRRFKNDICNNINNGTPLPTEDASNEPPVNSSSARDDQDTIEYVKQMRDNVDKQLIEFRKTIKELSDNVTANQISSSGSKGFNPEMIEAVRSFRTEMNNQYQEFSELIKDMLMKHQEEANRESKNLPATANKIIKDDSKFIYILKYNKIYYYLFIYI